MHDRLPLDHPQFKYSPSLNPYWTKLREEKLPVYCDNETEAHPGKWRAQFALSQSKSARSRPLHVEIGCNAGHVVVEWAARDPKACYIGLDWKFKMIHKAAEKVRKRDI